MRAQEMRIKKYKSDPCPPDEPNSEAETYDFLSQLVQNPIKEAMATPNSHPHEVVSYLQDLYPMSKGKHIMDYWKIITCNFPFIGKVDLRYMSIPASSTCVEEVFSQIRRLKCPAHASLHTRTIAHLTRLKERLCDAEGPY
ncbi:hypothetical protein O181_028117 [Austropuccinia psidii MF-1]|uniref:HAT C-terminal dimerisation domain-containing protein n=1 Tax=Austropuccinia psidii MF-1 TaxID=1389203 RepID=A0A9Q3CTY1_9BASI|nr:hypothetical protein [Austropuccinia psidii MF-1]